MSNKFKEDFARQLITMIYQANLADVNPKDDEPDYVMSNDLPKDAAHQDNFYGDVGNALKNLGYEEVYDYMLDSGEYDFDYAVECIEKQKADALREEKQELKEALEQVDLSIEMILDDVINEDFPIIELSSELADFLYKNNIEEDNFYEYDKDSFQRLTQIRKLIVQQLKELRA